MKRILFVLILLSNFAWVACIHAEKTAYAYYSNYKLVFRYGEIPENSVQTWDVSDTGDAAPEWTTKANIRNNIRTIVFHESFADALPKSCYGWFLNCVFLDSFEGLEYLNTSEVTNMSKMFAFCQSLKTIDLSSFDTNNVTNISEMFINCSSLRSVYWGDTKLSKVTSLSGLFYGCTWLTTIDMQNFDTSNVTTMEGMFHGCENLKTIDLSSFSTRNLYGGGMSMMFYNCKKLTTIYVGDEWSNEKTKNLSSHTFYNSYDLVGGNGTRYSELHQSAYYAQIDTNEHPGYLTYKESSTRISTTIKDDNSIIKCYDMGGRYVLSRKKGVYIIKMGNGETKKILIK